MRFRYIFFLMFAVGAVSCSKPAMISEHQDSSAIRLSAFRRMDTKAGSAFAQEGELSSDYTIYLSSYFNNETLHEGGDYFVGKAFKKQEDGWGASPAVFWPWGGTLNMLAVACMDGDFDAAANIRWHDDNSTLGAIVKVPSGSCLQSEIMFASASSKRMTESNVPLTFSHAQSWLHFSLAANDDDLFRIDRIVIRKVYTGGQFTINNTLFLSGEWSFRGFFKTDIVVPGSENLVLSSDARQCNILLPEQEACDITVYYRQKTDAGQDWEDAAVDSYTHPASANPWFYGIRNVFELNFASATAISLTTRVEEWTFEEQFIQVEPW